MLQMLSFSLQEIKELINSGNIQRELSVQEEYVSNKIKYYSQIKENIVKLKESPNKDIDGITDDIRQYYSAISDQFHDSESVTANKQNDRQHEELITLLRDLLDDTSDEDTVYGRIVGILPGLRTPEFSSRFFTLLRLSKGNRFKLDEIDRIEKILIKMRFSVDSDIM